MAATGFGIVALQRQFFHWSTGYLLLGWTTAMLLLLGSATYVIGQQLRPGTDLATDNDTGICKSVDIRNTIDQFEHLRGCYVVEGFVRILLFDNVNESLFSNISFPELTEITDYLLLYRVNGLRNLGQLFPNLAVIRGQNSFFGYAFVVFEMSSLQEIGLYSLTDITHGLVRIDKNPSLCFVNSIDWDLIVHEKGENFIRSIKAENECPLCPGDDLNEGSNANVTQCHKADRIGSYRALEGRHLCWNRQNCQKVCPENCRTCNKHGECCDNKCLGGCSGDRNVCQVCRNFSMGSSQNRQCMTHCPDGFFEYLERRCIKREECINLKSPWDPHNRVQHDRPYKIFNGSCILKCPANFMDDYENHTCKPCQGRCKKVCPSASIDSLASAQQLRGCTHIQGSLEIQIRGGRNIVNELEENLNMIEEIEGYLKIVRSFPLVSLNFLKNLKAIRGKNLESQKYVFVVLDNQNLQDLWSWDNNRTLQIDQGRLFFHFNPKLCLYKIEKLREAANLSEFTDLEVASNSNGDKIACNLTDIEVKVVLTVSRAVVLQWRPFKMDDNRKLLGYIVYSIEAPNRNITLYDGRDACGGDGWRVDDVGVPEDTSSNLTHFLPDLKPYTQYAYYVKTYTIATERYGAQSRIDYFRTKPDIPSKPLHVQVSSNTSDSFYITWQPPLNPYGNVRHYIVSGQQHKDTNVDELLKNRNYCHDPPISPKQQVLPVPVPVTPKTTSNDTCSCDDNSRTPGFKMKEEKETLSQISFEDELHNQVYIKKEASQSRKKRNAIGIGDQNINFPDSIDKNHQHSNNISIKNSTENGTEIWETFSFPVYGKTELYLNKLHHFTVYNIYIQACREREGPDDLAENCSDTSITTARTQKKGGADNITNVRVSNQSLGMVTLIWDEPGEPNGIVLTYQIEYKRMDIENSKPMLECITRNLFLNQSMAYSLKLNPGNYSLRLMATSQAGNGNYSPYIYFYIEETTSISALHIFGIVILVLLVICSPGAVFLWRRKCGAQVPNMKLIATVNPEYVSTVYVPDDWEVARKKIDLMRELGQGSFGMVYEGLARDIRGKTEIRCAVKTVNEHATNRERIEFLNEASVMKAFDTTHVVRLLGVVSQGQPTLVIMELMANGDLKSYLRSHRPDAETYTGRQPPSLKRILQMAIEIADGMAYLAAKKFVHRDLAARNCMVADDLTVKIGDFGMTRDIYETDYYRKGTKGLLPVRWMAPESLKDGVFTSSSDVWSYGVVLWEMATLASQPYQGLSNDQVLRYVIDGGVMERPENCPDKLYNLMRHCWQHKPLARPTFLELATNLVDDASQTFTQVSFYYSPAGLEARNSHTAPSPSQDDPNTPLRMVRDLDEDFSLGSSEAESDGELEVDTETHIDFPTFPPTSKDGSTTVNGYVSVHPTNGTTTTEC